MTKTLGPPGRDDHNGLDGWIGLQSTRTKGKNRSPCIRSVMGSIDLTGKIGPRGPKG